MQYVTLSRQEGRMMCHLANAHSVTGPAGIKYRTSFSGVCPLDRVLTYKNLIYLLNLQFCGSTGLASEINFWEIMDWED